MNIFLVTSCIKPTVGIINFEDRYKQTLETFDSIKLKDPDALIVFSDSSVYPLSENEQSTINSKINIGINFSDDENCKWINSHGLKSHGENYMLLKTIEHLKTIYDFKNLSGRMFKLGGRAKLQSEFDIKNHDQPGKYIFKKRLNSWMPKDIQEKYGSTHILETRLYSWCFSLVDDYVNVIIENFKTFDFGLDTEHSHMLHIDSTKLIEHDMLNCEMIMALNGQIMND